jgi:Transposase and inactivated derivatives
VRGCVAMRNVVLVNGREAFPPHPGPLPLRGGEGESLRGAAGWFPTVSPIPGIPSVCIREQSRQMECDVVELNVQADHVHLVVMILPQVRISDYMGRLKGKSAIRLFGAFRDLRRRPYWGNHFWVEGYCVGTVGLDEEKIRK